MEERYSFSLDEEVRCDYTVTKEAKKLWAAEMDLALQLEKICKKHNIKYFAAGGTLLGAVRHKGFIPWDNDMDFLMLKDDYEKFCEVAPKELQSPYEFQRTMSLSRIRNQNTTAITKRELATIYPPFNLGIFIDIFPLSAVPEKPSLQRKQMSMIKLIRRQRRGEKALELAKYKGNLNWKLFLNPNVILYKLSRLFNRTDLITKYNNVCWKYEKSLGINRYGITAFRPYDSRYIWDKRVFFGSVIYLPFENITVPAPAEFDLYLNTSFGDYRQFVKEGSAQHETTIFDADKPFFYYLEKIDKGEL